MSRQADETIKKQIILLLIITLQLLGKFVANNNHGITAAIVITATRATMSLVVCSISFVWPPRWFYWLLEINKIFFLILVWEAIGTAATPGLLCQPRVIVQMIVEKQMECRLAGETEVVGENLPQRPFCPSQNPTWPDPGFEPGSPRWEAGD
jgi:hypothetical protein